MDGSGDEWRNEAARSAIDATHDLLLQLLYVEHFRSRPEGAVAAFSTFGTDLLTMLRTKPPIDVPADRTQALLSDIAEGLLVDFLDGIAARLGIPVPDRDAGSAAA